MGTHKYTSPFEPRLRSTTGSLTGGRTDRGKTSDSQRGGAERYHYRQIGKASGERCSGRRKDQRDPAAQSIEIQGLPVENEIRAGDQLDGSHTGSHRLWNRGDHTAVGAEGRDQLTRGERIRILEVLGRRVVQVYVHGVGVAGRGA